MRKNTVYVSVNRIFNRKYRRLHYSCQGSQESLSSLYSDVGYSNVPVSGDVEFALSYHESAQKFIVHVVQCVDLSVADKKKNRTDSQVLQRLTYNR